MGMKFGRCWRYAATLLVLSISLGACSSGGGGAPGANAPQNPADIPVDQAVLTTMEGVVVKGPLAYATVKLFKLDTQRPEFFNPAAPLATATTNNLAQFTGLRIPADVSPPFVVVIDGSRAIDLDTNKTPVIPTLFSVITEENIANRDSIIATPLTMLAFDMARLTAGHGATNATFLAALKRASSLVKSTLAYGIDKQVDLFKWPVLPSNSTQTVAAQTRLAKHRAIVELFSSVVVQAAKQNKLTTEQQIELFARDLQSDGIFDDAERGVVMNKINLHTLVQAPHQVMIPNTTYRVTDIYQLLEYERRIVAPGTAAITLGVPLSANRVALASDMDRDGVLNTFDSEPLLAAAATQTGALSVKYNPGNYMMVFDGASRAAFTKIDGNPDFKGIQKRYYWNELETSKGVYDFSVIEADMYYLRNQGKRLVIQIQDKSFAGVPAYVPDYVLQEPEYAGGVVFNETRGWTAKKWNPAVQQRLSALYTVLGARFDNETTFEGVVFNETAPSLSCEAISQTDYTASGFRDGLITLLGSAKRAFPRTTVIQYVNYLSCGNAMLADVVAYAQSIGAGIGGPDITPDDPALDRWAYPYYSQYAGRMILGAAVQDYTIAKPKSGMTLAETYLRFGKESLHLNYIFWMQTEPYFSSDTVPTLARYRGVYK